MSKRKSISKKIRFEVFKRDSFQCQYCGKSSPDVVLNVDHIKPVSKGGDNDITNLITACFDCNAGKSDRELSDKTVIEKQRAQLDELNEKRIQLEMMLEWREGLQSINQTSLEAIVEVISSYSSYVPNESGERSIQKWIKKYPMKDILEAIDISFEKYLEFNGDKVTDESWNKAFNYVPRIINQSKTDKKKPYMKELFYARGILNNRLDYVNQRIAIELLEAAYNDGFSTDALKEFCKAVRTWSDFKDGITQYLEEFGGTE